jgi:hypothetical protein
MMGILSAPPREQNTKAAAASAVKLSGPDVADEDLTLFISFPFLCLNTSVVAALERII